MPSFTDGRALRVYVFIALKHTTGRLGCIYLDLIYKQQKRPAVGKLFMQTEGRSTLFSLRSPASRKRQIAASHKPPFCMGPLAPIAIVPIHELTGIWPIYRRRGAYGVCI